MKRVSHMALLAAGTASALLLSACDDKKPQSPPASAQAAQGKLYRDLDACIADAKDMDAVASCRAAEQQAKDKMAEAPQYEQQARCEDVYGPGNCVPRYTVVHDGGYSFVPMMMGFWWGSSFASHTTIYQPVFINRYGATYAGSQAVAAPNWINGSPVARSGSVPASGSVSSAPAATEKSSTVSRGGFGSSATATASKSSGG
jgi:uncharacterized protein YgiB involved in biofilm formation